MQYICIKKWRMGSFCRLLYGCVGSFVSSVIHSIKFGGNAFGFFCCSDARSNDHSMSFGEMCSKEESLTSFDHPTEGQLEELYSF